MGAGSGLPSVRSHPLRSRRTSQPSASSLPRAARVSALARFVASAIAPTVLIRSAASSTRARRGSSGSWRAVSSDGSVRVPTPNSSSSTSSAPVIGTAPSRSSPFVPRATREVTRPGTAATDLPRSRAKSVVIRLPLGSAASTTTVIRASPAMIRLRAGKLHLNGGVPGGSSERTIVFIHGLWLLPSSWDRWAELFEDAGYAAVTPSWPDDPETVAEARANPEVFARKTLGQVASHTAEVIGRLEKKPAIIGHSTGGLLAQIIADRGLSAVTVAIDPGPFRGVLPLPLSTLRSSSPVLRNPLNRGRAVTLTLDEFKYGWTNALDDEETKRLYETYHVAAPGVALMQMANANLNPRTEAKLDPRNPDRGPLLIIEGGNDHTVAPAIANAAYKRQRRNPAVTEFEGVPNRGHALTIDSGWREVAEKALAFVERFVGSATERRAADPIALGDDHA